MDIDCENCGKHSRCRDRLKKRKPDIDKCFFVKHHYLEEEAVKELILLG